MKQVWLVLLIGAALTLASCAESPTRGEGITVESAWVRPSPIGSGISAGYMTIHNGGPDADSLIGARADFASSVEVHESFVENEVASMRPVESIPLAAGETVALEPGGYHLMLMDTEPGIEVGQIVTVVLIFEKAGEVPVEAEVRAE